MLSVKRFTPTGVGTIVVRDADFVISAVHPHGRGDNETPTLNTIATIGSPPRAWGQSIIERNMYQDMRFTPTGVGTIRNLVSIRAKSAVHPHGRGDNTGKAPVFRTPIGSPPRAWGQSTLVVPDARAPRFTPTGVGTMQIRRIFLKIPSVHPHGRGDNVESPFPISAGLGSPPRAWGQCHGSSGPWRNTRFTPTGVGTMCMTGGRPGSGSVHPHGRGDNVREAYQRYSSCGSPPRAWGQCRDVLARGGLWRFTPTGVGTIRGRGRGRAKHAVHPHGRGDNGCNDSC